MQEKKRSTSFTPAFFAVRALLAAPDIGELELMHAPKQRALRLVAPAHAVVELLVPELLDVALDLNVVEIWR